MALPAFIDVPETEQLGEIRSYLQSLGADLKDSGGEGMYTDLEEIIPATGVLWKVQDDASVEGVLNSILSLLIYQPPEELERLCKLMSENLSKATSREKAHIRLKILNNLFHGVGETSLIAYPIYCGLLKVVAQAGSTENVNTDLDTVKKWIEIDWQLSRDKTNNVLRLLYEGLKESKHSEAAGKVMVELLGTYTEDNASAARDDAHRCIVNSLADPNTYLFDHLLTLRPVKFLEGELIHELLTIFVSGTLHDYQAFFNSHQDFVKTVGLSHEANIKKMRILTFLGMAVEQKEIAYATIQQDLSITEEQIEEFLIDVIKTRMAQAKVDQLQQKVNISTVTHRTFGKQQWQTLRKQLVEWQQNLGHVRARLESVTAPQLPPEQQ